ncbi:MULTISPECIES: hypothetical protein [Roseicella]|uniref:DUF945 domain-containing protein n=1 Tax=Roseicella aerolata TaxID=2883479 RepID=A0A9X1IHB9_9PROT|nr:MULTISPECIES: hypothetical protein [Roseicella]MCB4824219.1 DUF945 domain-containing protein [Roseicella aerolata]
MSFIGRTTILRPNGVTPLSDEDIRKLAPSAFATEAHESRSARYAYIPTSEVIRGMREGGFLPMAAGHPEGARGGVGDRRREADRRLLTGPTVQQADPCGGALTFPPWKGPGLRYGSAATQRTDNG